MNELGRYPAGELGVRDLGSRHFALHAESGRWLWWHDCPKQEHVSWMWFGQDHDQKHMTAHLVTGSVLTVGGSLICNLCGDHGHITDGQWKPA